MALRDGSVVTAARSAAVQDADDEEAEPELALGLALFNELLVLPPQAPSSVSAASTRMSMLTQIMGRLGDPRGAKRIGFIPTSFGDAQERHLHMTPCQPTVRAVPPWSTRSRAKSDIADRSGW
jgi:hypothetical protein